MKEKFILDCTCGGRTIWFNKKHPNAIYTDIRREEKGLIYDRPNFEVQPDEIMDFRALKFPDKSFKMVIWDPPHFMNLSSKTWVTKKYGCLNSETWQSDIQKGFNECWRVLDDFGTLILKWSCPEKESKKRKISTSDLLKLFPVQPIVGHPSGSKSGTIWMSFLKIPQISEQQFFCHNCNHKLQGNEEECPGCKNKLLWALFG